MNELNDRDPIELLRESNPARAERLPSANLARIRARVQENLMTETQSGRGGIPIVKPVRLAIGVAGVVAAAVIAVAAFGPRASLTPPQPSGDDGGVGGGGGGGTAMCIRYDLEILAQAEYAFDGTVTAIHGDQVTFAVGQWFRGSGDPTVTLTETGLGSGAVFSEPLVGFEVGGRYLVSGSGGIVTGCGFSMPYDDANAAEWAATFGG